MVDPRSYRPLPHNHIVTSIPQHVVHKVHESRNRQHARGKKEEIQMFGSCYSNYNEMIFNLEILLEITRIPIFLFSNLLYDRRNNPLSLKFTNYRSHIFD